MLDKSLFRHVTSARVRNYEIDWQGIVHNAVYLLYFEMARVEYLQMLGVRVNREAIVRESRIVVARNEIDYLAPAHFGDDLVTSTRISFVRTSSFAFEGILENKKSGVRIAENVSIHVWLDRITGGPVPVADWLRKAVRDFEGENAIITWPEYLT
jgi:acyl-CoA thioester hydrolase